MDWNGIGTLAFFFSSGAIGVALITLRAYKAKLASQLEWERLLRSGTPSEEVLEQIKTSRPRFNGSLSVLISLNVS